MVGIDVHKPDKTATAEMGGVVSLTGIVLGSLTLLVSGVDGRLLLGLLTIILVGVTGVLDDIKALRQRFKPLLVAAAAIPLIIALGHRTGFTMPGLGYLDYGPSFLILIVPLGLTTSANLTNMLAGFNGLELGTGSIALAAVTILSAFVQEWTAVVVGTVTLAAVVPLLKYNWYPARIFPGDTGTLMMGGAVATVTLMSGIEFAGLICLVPAMIDFALKISTRKPFGQRARYGDTQIRPDNTLVPPPYRALAHAFLRLTPLTEPELVSSLLVMQTVYSSLAITLGLIFLR